MIQLHRLINNYINFADFLPPLWLLPLEVTCTSYISPGLLPEQDITLEFLTAGIVSQTV